MNDNTSNNLANLMTVVPPARESKWHLQPKFYTEKEGGEWRVWPEHIKLNPDGLLKILAAPVEAPLIKGQTQFGIAFVSRTTRETIYFHALAFFACKLEDYTEYMRWDAINGYTGIITIPESESKLTEG